MVSGSIVSAPTVVHEGSVIHDSVPTEAYSDSVIPSEPSPTWAGPEPSDQTVNKPAETETLPLDDTPAPMLADGTESPADLEPAPEDPAEVSDVAADEPEADGGLFGEEPAEEPVAEVTPMPEDDGGLFGAAPEEPAAAAAEPADDGGLFGETTEEPAAEDDDGLFGESADEPMEDDAPMEDEGGLFGGATEEPADDGGLFGESAEEPADDGGLFGETEEAMEDDGGLFGESVEEPAESDPVDEAPADDADEEDSLFDFSGVLQEQGGLESLALRQWVDNTGEFTVYARLLAVQDGHVKLLKANGRTSTVPFSRLCSDDLEFVNMQAAALKSRVLSQTASR